MSFIIILAINIPMIDLIACEEREVKALKYVKISNCPYIHRLFP